LNSDFLRLLVVWNLGHPCCNSWEQERPLILESDSLDHLREDLDADLSVLFDLVLERDHESSNELLPVEEVQSLL